MYQQVVEGLCESISGLWYGRFARPYNILGMLPGWVAVPMAPARLKYDAPGTD